MARLTDPDRVAAYRDALNNWAVDGCVSFDMLSKEGARYLRELGIKQRELKELMYDYVAADGEIDEVAKKTRIMSRIPSSIFIMIFVSDSRQTSLYRNANGP